MKTAEEILRRHTNSEDWTSGMIRDVTDAMEEYANQKLNLNKDAIKNDTIAGEILNNFLKDQPPTSPLYEVSSKLLRQLIMEGINYHPQTNELLDLDGKTIPVKFKVSKYAPKVDIRLD